MLHHLVHDLSRLAQVGKLLRALHQAQLADEIRRLDRLAPAIQRRPDFEKQPRRQAHGVHLDADALALHAERIEHLLDLPAARRILRIDRDTDIFANRRVSGIAEVGRARQVGQLPVGAEEHATEDGKSVRIETGQPVHVFELEQQDAVELELGHALARPLLALGKLGAGEMNIDVIHDKRPPAVFTIVQKLCRQYHCCAGNKNKTARFEADLVQ